MAIFRTDRTIGSDRTPERATLGDDGRWRLTWLPEFALTREQAIAGVRLDEILSDPALVNDRMAIAEATTCADRIGIILDQAVIRLWKSIIGSLALCAVLMTRIGPMAAFTTIGYGGRRPPGQRRWWP
ncbi:hypothetical protein [Nocardia alba]|uniref:Uncharacterized protein n=1 Tax=Nocardia alba TaxID=225051 RepID=A0A4R1FQU3_9NOCA|nr:hypothetical protein [Nocardia alba]TCJ97053.1 hypothetical protein DFR71_3089 [Nocardia alba]